MSRRRRISESAAERDLQATSRSPLSCDHANEVPARCPCDGACYCKGKTCRPSLMTVIDAAAKRFDARPVHRARRARVASAAAAGIPKRGAGSVAAKWAHETGETLTAASERFGVGVSTVSEAWRRLYPGQSAYRSRRDQARQWPEDELSC